MTSVVDLLGLVYFFVLDNGRRFLELNWLSLFGYLTFLRKFAKVTRLLNNLEGTMTMKTRVTSSENGKGFAIGGRRGQSVYTLGNPPKELEAIRRLIAGGDYPCGKQELIGRIRNGVRHYDGKSDSVAKVIAFLVASGELVVRSGTYQPKGWILPRSRSASAPIVLATLGDIGAGSAGMRMVVVPKPAPVAKKATVPPSRRSLPVLGPVRFHVFFTPSEEAAWGLCKTQFELAETTNEWIGLAPAEADTGLALDKFVQYGLAEKNQEGYFILVHPEAVRVIPIQGRQKKPVARVYLEMMQFLAFGAIRPPAGSCITSLAKAWYDALVATPDSPGWLLFNKVKKTTFVRNFSSTLPLKPTDNQHLMGAILPALSAPEKVTVLWPGFYRWEAELLKGSPPVQPVGIKRGAHVLTRGPVERIALDAVAPAVPVPAEPLPLAVEAEVLQPVPVVVDLLTASEADLQLRWEELEALAAAGEIAVEQAQARLELEITELERVKLELIAVAGERERREAVLVRRRELLALLEEAKETAIRLAAELTALGY